MRRRSAKQAEFSEELKAVTPQLYIRSQGTCEAKIPNVCAGPYNLHRHHRRRRNVRKDGKANALSNLLLVCQPCHALIHHKPRWARENGFIVSSNADPDFIPVTKGSRWMP